MSLEVYDVSTDSMSDDIDLSEKLHGRRQIFTAEEEITDTNVIEVLQKSLPIHEVNRAEIRFLERYVRGWQPVLNRTKQYNAEINNRVVVNIANQIITFKASEFAGEPIQYVSRGSKESGGTGRDLYRKRENDTGLTGETGDGADNSKNWDADDGIPAKVAQINNMMLTEGKQTKDLELAQKMFTAGVGYRIVFHETGDDPSDYLDEAPFEMYVADSKNSFVVRRADVTKRVLMGVTYVYKTPPMGDVEYTVYTPNVTYTIANGANGLEIKNSVRHNFGMVCLIEYPCNPSYMSAIEPVIPLLNAINLTQSNRMDGIEQFIQALLVFDGVDISREDFLELKDLGAIKLPNTEGGGYNGRKLYYLNEQLDQSQTQTLVNDLYKTVLSIVGMPAQGDGNTSDSSNNGAIILKNGWWHAEARALETQAMWKKAETDFLKIVLKICDETNTLKGLKLSDIEPRFWRQSYEDLLVKTQSFSTLRTAGMPAIQAFTFSHLSRDPESDAIVYDDYQERLAEELDRLNGVGGEGAGDTPPLKEDPTVNPNEPGNIEAAAKADNRSGGGERSEGQWAICPVCGKRFIKKEPNQIYNSIACANRARKNG